MVGSVAPLGSAFLVKYVFSCSQSCSKILQHGLLNSSQRFVVWALTAELTCSGLWEPWEPVSGSLLHVCDFVQKLQRYSRSIHSYSPRRRAFGRFVRHASLGSHSCLLTRHRLHHIYQRSLLDDNDRDSKDGFKLGQNMRCAFWLDESVLLSLKENKSLPAVTSIDILNNLTNKCSYLQST